MRLLKIDVVGFKSFAYPTSVVFDEGITSIVGPNGCGKSNIVDALFWCMGEQSAKNLRGTSMEDVIFNGASHVKPAHMAEVTVTFSKEGVRLRPEFEGFSEISVTRRLYRSGDSDYMINRIPCRLRDIHELFLDTGIGGNSYAIIKQGQIERLISMKPLERRGIIEEAAGITKFKVKKAESLKKLEETQQNFEKLNIIVNELAQQIDRLKEQSAKALQYQSLRDRYRYLLLVTHRHLFVSALEKYLLLKDQAALLEKDLGTLEVELANLVVSEEQDSQAFLVLESNFQDLEKKLQDLSAQLAQLEKEDYGLRIKKENFGQNLEESQSRLADIYQELQQLEEEVHDFKNQQDQQELLFQDLSQKVNFGELEKKKQSLEVEKNEQEMAKARGELNEIEAKNDAIKRNHEFLYQQLEQKKMRIQEYQSQHTEEKKLAHDLLEKKQGLVDELQNKELLLENLESEKELLLDQIKTFHAQKQKNLHELKEIEVDLGSSQKQKDYLVHLQNSHEGLGQNQKQFLKNWQEGKFADLLKVHGVLLDSMKIPSSLLPLISKALGPYLETNIISHQKFAELNPGEANKALAQHLAPQFKGGLHFISIPESLLSSLQQPEKYQALFPDKNGPWKELLVHPALQNFLSSFLSLFAFEGFEQDKSPNLENFWIDSQGFFGFKNEFISFGDAQTGLQNRVEREKEIEHLNQKIETLYLQAQDFKQKMADLDFEISQTNQQAEILEGQLDLAQSEHDEIKAEKNQVELQLAKAEQSLKTVQQKEQEMLQELDQITDRLNKETKALDKSHERLRELRMVIMDAEAKQIALRAHLVAINEDFESHRTQYIRLDAELKNKKQQFALQSKRLETLTEQKDEAEENIRNILQEHEEIDERLEALQTDVQKIQSQKDDLNQKAATQKIQLQELRLASQEQSASMRERRKILDEKRKSNNDLSLQLKTLEMDLEKIRSRVREKLDIDINDAQADGIIENQSLSQVPAAERESWQVQADGKGHYFADSKACDGAQKILDKHSREITQLGEINLSSIREYEQALERFNFLDQQKRDLEQAHQQLKAAIEHIDLISSQRFMETFQRVNQHFGKLFPILFSGGTAQLVMVEPEKPLETGIEIMAQPPGKNPATLNLLSGGEKALTAVSLIFGIFNLKPAPFCLLDEVDAPLDDANIGRFNLLIQKMSSITQFILITHNKKTMEVARNLFGVTQEIKGISKVASVRLRDSMHNPFQGTDDLKEGLSAQAH